jgi:hypothetical protein
LSLALAAIASFATLLPVKAAADGKPFNRWGYILEKGIGTARHEPRSIVTFLQAENLSFTCSEGVTAETAENKECSGGKYLHFPFTKSGQFVEFEVDVAEPGEYTLIAGSWNTPANGYYRLSIDGKPVGREVNQCYTRKAPEPCWHNNDEIETIGNVRFETPGKKKLRFTVTDKLYFSRGYELTFDLIKLKKFAPAAPDVRALVPVADAYVDSGNPLEFMRDANYGGGTLLRAGKPLTANRERENRR